MFVTAIIAAVVTAAVVGYFFYQHSKDQPARDAVAAANAEADRKNALYLQHCADNNLVPYADAAEWQAFLATV